MGTIDFQESCRLLQQARQVHLLHLQNAAANCLIRPLMQTLRQAWKCRLLEEREKALHRVQHELENLREDHTSAKVHEMWKLPAATCWHADSPCRELSNAQARAGLYHRIDIGAIGMLQDQVLIMN